MYSFDDIMKGAKIAIIGVGGGGNNAVNKMASDNLEGITFIIANTDIQVLNNSPIEKKIVLGKELTKGLGAGANPEIGEKSAIDSIEEIRQAVTGYDLVFVAAGMGGGTGTGAAPIIAKVAKETGALVVGIVTTPFSFEGKRRMLNASIGLEEFKQNVDSIIIVSNDRLKEELGTIPLTESFHYSDAILKQAVRTITDLINSHSLINLDFADIKTVIEGQGLALIGVGRSSGENKAIEAAVAAINSPILESSIEGALNAIVNIAGSSTNLSIEQAHEAIDTIKAQAGEDIDIIFGVTINDALDEEIVVSVIATGLNSTKSELIKEARRAAREADGQYKMVNSIKKDKDIESLERNSDGSVKYEQVIVKDVAFENHINKLLNNSNSDSNSSIQNNDLQTKNLINENLINESFKENINKQSYQDSQLQSNQDAFAKELYSNNIDSNKKVENTKIFEDDYNEAFDEETEEQDFTNEKLLEFDLFDEDENENE